MRVREETAREMEEMENTGRGKTRIPSQYRQLHNDLHRNKTRSHTFLNPIHVLLVSDSVCFMTSLYRVPQRFSSKVLAASLGNVFLWSSGTGESHNTHWRELSTCRGFPNQHQYKIRT